LTHIDFLCVGENKVMSQKSKWVSYSIAATSENTIEQSVTKIVDRVIGPGTFSFASNN
jgi:hypothetical protein